MTKSKKPKLTKSKNLKLTKSKKSDLAKANSPGTDFLTSRAKKAFIHLQKAFTETPILRHFDPGYHIYIKTDASEYAINKVLSQMTLNQYSPGHVIHKGSNYEIGQWYPIAFFSRKIILAGTWYKDHNQELLAIVQVFKTWHHYLESYKYEVFILTDYNNLR